MISGDVELILGIIALTIEIIVFMVLMYGIVYGNRQKTKIISVNAKHSSENSLEKLKKSLIDKLEKEGILSINENLDKDGSKTLTVSLKVFTK